MSGCRSCKKQIDKYETIFGYCFDCAKKLGAKIEDKRTDKKVT